ncbi:MlaD family protein [Pedobacter aquatilis]|uniref:MlaD family protein n=1 Tax=Pedobacter aquatilis TaxID=351343 RepID=UPI0025B320EC|nr:MlaD family protein [Pedobacter aquatilis]MDN3587545.1 MlaD family protein [Pedobacter aquatilis]
MNDNRKKITVGIFIAIGILIFVVAIFTLGSQKKTFVKSFNLSVVFNDIQGLKKGNNVWFSGVKIGTIKRIDFYGSSQVKVLLSIEEDVHKYIHKDAGASIGADGLIGNKIVVLTGGTPKFPFVEDGDMLKVNTSLSTDDIMKTLQVNNKNLVDVTADFKVLARNLVDGKGAAGALLTDEAVAQNFKLMVSNLSQTSQMTSKAAVELREFSKTINSKDGLMHKMLTDTAVFNKFDNAVTNLNKTTESASLMAANLERASSKLKSSDNAAGLLLNDEQTARQVKSIMLNLEKSSKKLDEDLEALQSNFLLRGFFKKRAKDSLKLKNN